MCLFTFSQFGSSQTRPRIFFVFIFLLSRTDRSNDDNDVNIDGPKLNDVFTLKSFFFFTLNHLDLSCELKASNAPLLLSQSIIEMSVLTIESDLSRVSINEGLTKQKLRVCMLDLSPP